MWDVPDMAGYRPWELSREVAGKGRASQPKLLCHVHSNLSSSTCEARGSAVHTSSRGVQPPVLPVLSQSLHSSSHTMFNVWDGGVSPCFSLQQGHRKAAGAT